MYIYSSKPSITAANESTITSQLSNHSARVSPWLLIVTLLALLTVAAQSGSDLSLSAAGLDQPQQEETLEPANGQAETTPQAPVQDETLEPANGQAETALQAPVQDETLEPEIGQVEATPQAPVQEETLEPANGQAETALQAPVQEAVEAAGGQSGVILSLSAAGGSNFNETITIGTIVQATSHTNNTNFYFEIRASNGTVVATHNFDGVPSMNASETFSYSWTSNNSAYPVMGDYSVTLCWSPGGSRNCNIASATTTFYSANSLGPLLTVVLIGFIARWLWMKRKTLFGRVGETIP